MPILATKTLDAIDAALFADQGRSYRHHLREAILETDDAFDDAEHDAFRSHFGISQSGDECARKLYYNFRWATPVVISSKGLRLFNRGHLEEARFAALLRMIGCTLWRAGPDGAQYRVSYHGGHYGSAIDGVVQGVPDLPDQPVLAEFKTHNNKSFRQLAGDEYVPPQGVRKAKISHYAQMQQYMGYYKLEWGLYGAVNKDSDELFFELVPYDRTVDEGYRERAKRIIWAKEAPPRISENAAFWKCRWCDHRKVCHAGATPSFNCRTCAASRPQTDGSWWCDTHRCILDKQRQLSGCPDYQDHPSF